LVPLATADGGDEMGAAPKEGVKAEAEVEAKVVVIGGRTARVARVAEVVEVSEAGLDPLR
jgi:hypothetical protein